jgi:hypothetical protein
LGRRHWLLLLPLLLLLLLASLRLFPLLLPVLGGHGLRGSCGLADQGARPALEQEAVPHDAHDVEALRLRLLRSAARRCRCVGVTRCRRRLPLEDGERPLEREALALDLVVADGDLDDVRVLLIGC